MFDRVPKTCVRFWSKETYKFAVVITDSYDPTQELAFFRVIVRKLSADGLGVVFITHSDLVRANGGDSVSTALASIEHILSDIPISCIIMSRYTGLFWECVLKFSRARSVPVAVFYDDNLLEVPVELGSAHKIYASPERREAILATMREANVVLASTHALKKQLERYPARRFDFTPIYCSTLADEFTPLKPGKDRGTTVGYMASHWHRHDIEYIKNHVIDVLEADSDIRVEIFGFEWGQDLAPAHRERITCRLPVYGSYSAFRAQLMSLDWDIAIAPLRPLRFNRCKANTKWIEYSCAGLPVVASKLEPYRDIDDAAVVRVSDDDWHDRILDLLADKPRRDALRVAAREHLRDDFSLEKHAAQLGAFIEGLESEGSLA